MKPDIRYITPYLPYKLLFQVTDELYQLVHVTASTSLEYVGGLNPIYSNPKNFRVEEIKPLLKPLDSLLTDCPADIRNEFSDFLFYAFLRRIKNQDNPISIAHTSTFLTLLELHYDVFQLIPQGLALDINTVVTK